MLVTKNKYDFKKIILAMAILYLLISSLRYKSEYIKLINYNYKQAHRLAEKRYTELSDMDYADYDFDQFIEDVGYIGGIDKKFFSDIRLRKKDFKSLYGIISFSNYKYGDLTGELKEQIDWNDDVKKLVCETFKEYFYIIKESTNKEIGFFTSFFTINKDYKKITDDINKVADIKKEKLYKLLFEGIL
ncbi:hypothetical protein [Tepidimicrobium xylanilyticum]